MSLVDRPAWADSSFDDWVTPSPLGVWDYSVSGSPTEYSGLKREAADGCLLEIASRDSVTLRVGGQRVPAVHVDVAAALSAAETESTGRGGWASYTAPPAPVAVGMVAGFAINLGTNLTEMTANFTNDF